MKQKGFAAPLVWALVYILAFSRWCFAQSHERSRNWRLLPKPHRHRIDYIDDVQQPEAQRGSSPMPWMTLAERMMISVNLRPVHVMLEWGSGGSTHFFSKQVLIYYSIEHSRGFYESQASSVQKLRNVDYRLVEVKPGANGWRGFLQPGTYRQFKEYVQEIDRLGVRAVDRVLVDGRARIACAVYSLRYLRQDSLVFIHDFAKRELLRAYNKVFIYFEMVSKVDELVVLRPKLNMAGYVVPDDKIHALYNWYTGAEVGPS